MSQEANVSPDQGTFGTTRTGHQTVSNQFSSVKMLWRTAWGQGGGARAGAVGPRVCDWV